MKNIIPEINKFPFLKNHKISILLWIFIFAYIIYFSYFTILRNKTLYSSYYDLGIMNQTVYNTYKSIKDKNPAHILEMTDPDSVEQIKRMAIHNDILLALIAPLYFIQAGPETLLILQTVVLALGAWAVYKITQIVLQKNKYKDILSLVFAVAYLLYSPMQRANIFDFHPVTLTTSLLLFMFYFFLVKKYWLSFLFFILSILSKEQVALTTAFFGLYALLGQKVGKSKGRKSLLFPLAIITISIVWFVLSVSVIIPYFRGGHHFALEYYGDFGDSPTKIIAGIVKNPFNLSKYLFRGDTFNYFIYLLGPLGFLSILSPIYLLIALPELAINLLSNNWNMRNIIFHYTSVIQPFVFIAAIYGTNTLIQVKSQKSKVKNTIKNPKVIGLVILFCAVLFSYFKSPLPYSREAEIHPFKYPQEQYKEIAFWSNTLKDDSIKISTTGQIAPHFSSRQYLYLFSDRYRLTDYVVVRLTEIYNYPEKDILIPVYNKLKVDKNFQLIYNNKGLEIYKKV